MERVTLKFLGVSEISGIEKVGLIMLTDENRERELSIMCDQTMINQIMLRVGKVPGTAHLLPDVLCNVLRNQTMLDFYIIFSDVIDGEYQATLYNCASLIPVKIRASDAVLLSIISDIPMYMEKILFLRQSTTYERNNTKVGIPLNTLSRSLLEEALQEAIDKEQYELASTLNEELQKRFHSQGTDNEPIQTKDNEGN